MTVIHQAGAELHEDDLYPSESIVRQKLLTLKELVAQPEPFNPDRDYVQKDDLERDKEEPNLQHFFKALAKKAIQSWVEWANALGPEELTKRILGEDYQEYLEYLEIDKQEEEEYKRQEERKQLRSISETPGFIGHVQVSNLEFDTFSVSPSERIQDIALREFETIIARTTHNQKSDDLSFLYPTDPDFLPPLSTSAKYIIRPASRPYNLTFLVRYLDKDNRKHRWISKPSYGKEKKDYTTVEDILYILRQRGDRPIMIPGFDEYGRPMFDRQGERIYVPDIKILTPKDKIRWEPDLRYSPRNPKSIGEDGKETESILPDPRNYRKIDCDTKTGRRVLKALSENPYNEFTEVSWEHGGGKKVALVKQTSKYLVWCYVDRRALKPRWKPKVIYPQTREIWDRNIKANARYLVGIKVRVSRHDTLPYPYNFMVKRSLEEVARKLTSEGMLMYQKVSEPDIFGAVEYTFLKKELWTAKQRRLARISD